MGQQMQSNVHEFWVAIPTLAQCRRFFVSSGDLKLTSSNLDTVSVLHYSPVGFLVGSSWWGFPAHAWCRVLLWVASPDSCFPSRRFWMEGLGMKTSPEECSGWDQWVASIPRSWVEPAEVLLLPDHRASPWIACWTADAGSDLAFFPRWGRNPGKILVHAPKAPENSQVAAQTSGILRIRRMLHFGGFVPRFWILSVLF